MISSMSDEIVHIFKGMKFSKSMCDALDLKYGMMSPTKVRDITIKLGKAKCQSTKRIEKHFQIIKGLFAGLEKDGHRYSNEQKRLIVVNSFPEHSEWNQMHFSGMNTFTTYSEVEIQVEHEAERHMETVGDKSQSTVIVPEAKPKEKLGACAKKKVSNHAKTGPLNEGVFEKKKALALISQERWTSLKLHAPIVENWVTSRVSARKQLRYISATLQH